MVSSAAQTFPTRPTRRVGRFVATRFIATVGATLTLAVTGGTGVLGATAAQAATAGHQVQLTSLTSDAQLAKGVLGGTVVRNGSVVFDTARRTEVIDGRTWEMARYATPVVRTRSAFTNLVPSWQATTPGATAIRVQVRGVAADGAVSSWDDVAFWAASDKFWKRHTYATQPDDLGSMNVDTWQANSSAGLVGWQLRVDLLRPVGGTNKPSLQRISAVAAKLSTASSVATTPTGTTANARKALGKVLAVPQYSQMVHSGHYPAWGGGGESWCSPTSVAMVLGYFQAQPTNAQRTGIPQNHVDGQVDFAARQTYDHTYRGAGNWAFSTAYAGTRGREVSVARFTSLAAIEDRIARGIPVIVSVRFARGELSGAPIRATNGHLLVVVGFDRSGNVVVNDPAASSNAGVRRTYNRAQFENVWLPASPSGSGGLAYIIR